MLLLQHLVIPCLPSVSDGRVSRTSQPTVEVDQGLWDHLQPTTAVAGTLLLNIAVKCSTSALFCISLVGIYFSASIVGTYTAVNITVVISSVSSVDQVFLILMLKCHVSALCHRYSTISCDNITNCNKPLNNKYETAYDAA